MGSLSGLCKPAQACPRAQCVASGARRVGRKPPGQDAWVVFDYSPEHPVPRIHCGAEPSEGPGAPPAVAETRECGRLTGPCLGPGSAQGTAGTRVATPAPRCWSGGPDPGGKHTHSSGVYLSLCSRLAGGFWTDLWAPVLIGKPALPGGLLSSRAPPPSLEPCAQGWDLPRALESRSCIHGGDTAQENDDKKT